MCATLDINILSGMLLKNITIENNIQALVVSMTHNGNANITHNRGHVLIYSFEESTVVKFHGSHTFANNNNYYKDFVLPVLHLIQRNVTFYGNTTFLQNKGRDGGAIYAKLAEINFQGNVVFLQNGGENGGAIYAKDAQINFQGSMMFLENRGGYGGVLMLYQNVSVQFC